MQTRDSIRPSVTETACGPAVNVSTERVHRAGPSVAQGAPRVTARPAQPRPTEARAPVSCVRADSSLDRVCLWGAPFLTAEACWYWLYEAINHETSASEDSSDRVTRPEAATASSTVCLPVAVTPMSILSDVAVLKAVQKVVRVTQDGNTIRYDLYAPSSMCKTLELTIKACLERNPATRTTVVKVSQDMRRCHQTTARKSVSCEVPLLSSESEWPTLPPGSATTTSTTQRSEVSPVMPTNITYAQTVQNNTLRPTSKTSVPESTKQTGTMSNALYAISWNTNSVWNRKADLETLACLHQAAILALQETRIRACDWQLRLPGFIVVSEPATFRDAGQGSDRIHARGGLCIAVAKRLTKCVSLVGHQSPYTLFVRVWLHGEKSLVIGNVYVPPCATGGNIRQKAAIRAISENLQDLLTRYSTSAFMILGDWNMKASKVERILAGIERTVYTGEEVGRLKIQVPEGALEDPMLAYTYHHQGRAVSPLDHCIIGGGTRVSSEAVQRLRQLACCRVDRKHGASDHWPLVTRLQLKPLAADEYTRNRADTRESSATATADNHNKDHRFAQYLRKTGGEEVVVEWEQVPSHRKGKRITATSIRKYSQKVMRAVKTWKSDAVNDTLRKVGLMPSTVAATTVRCAPRQRANVIANSAREWNERRPRDASFKSIQCSNYWELLAAKATEAELEGDVESLEGLAQSCIDTVYRVADENHLTSNFAITRTDGESVETKERRLVSKRVVLLSIKKRTAFENWSETQTPEARDRYRTICKEVRTQVRTERTLAWSDFIAQGMRRVTVDKDAASYWNWIRTISALDFARGRVTMTGMSSANTILPVIDPVSGTIVLDPHRIERAWHSHFSTLTSDVTGHSRDAQHWEQVFTDAPLRQYEDELPNVNDDITWFEARMVLESFMNNKAPGLDGIPNGFIKLLLKRTSRCDVSFGDRDDLRRVPNEALAALIEAKLVIEDHETDSREQPTSPMAASLFTILKLMWKNGRVPSSWQTSWMVQVPKKGDATVMDNYRGISLMDFMVKWLTKIVVRRIATGLEQTGRLCREQAGFRRSQESVGQAACLIEIIQRRQCENKETYAAFLDFSKAYDMVPHMALFAKMQAIGVRGKALELVKNLYETTKFVIRTPMSNPLGSAIPHRLEAIHQRKGLRQGCPMSPTLFNIFINDLFDDHQRHKIGIMCPMRPLNRREHTEHVEQVLGSAMKARISGLLFADDTVILARSRTDLQRSFELCTQWADRNEMRFNAAKCGIMGFSGKSRSSPLYAQRRLKHRVEPFVLQNQQVPVVEHYIYLGVELTTQLDTKVMAKHRLELAKKAATSMAAFFRNQCIPTSVRTSVLKAVVMPMALYGAEIWGMHKAVAQQTQTEVNRIMRAIAGRSRASNVCILGVATELNVSPIYALAAARRARALIKWSLSMSSPATATWISILGSTLPSNNRWKTWVSSSRSWLKGQLPEVARDLLKQQLPENDDNEERRRTPAASAHLQSVKAYNQTKVICRTKAGVLNKSKSWMAFQAGKYHSLIDNARASKWIELGTRFPHLSKGLSLLMQFRSNIALLAPDMVKSGKLDEKYQLLYCPCCNQVGLRHGETRAHVLLECTAWNEQRLRLLSDLIQRAAAIVKKAIFNARHRTVERICSINSNLMVTLLLGGAIGEKDQKITRWATMPQHDPNVVDDTDREESLLVDSPIEEEMLAHIAFWRPLAPRGVGGVGARYDNDPLPDNDDDWLDDETDAYVPMGSAVNTLLNTDIKEVAGSLRVAMFLQEIWPVRGRRIAEVTKALKEANLAATRVTEADE